MPKKLTKEEIIARGEAVHGKGTYDYSRMRYIDKDTPVELVCPNGHVFYQRVGDHLRGHGCKYCARVGRLNTEEFIKRAIAKHQGKYRYPNTVYVRSSERVEVECPLHGPFPVEANAHLQGQGCPTCARLESKKPVFGVGVNDYDGYVKINGKHIESYNVWHQLLKRLYCESSLKHVAIYRKVKLCDEWVYFSNFKRWFDENAQYYHKGWALDKDLICKTYNINPKIYCPDTCLFLPSEINNSLIFKEGARVDLPIGVRRAKNGRFHSTAMLGMRRQHLGTFDTPEEAFAAYKAARESHLRMLADKYKDELSPKAYKLLKNINITIDY